MNKIKLTSLSLLLIFQMFASKSFSQEQTQSSFSLQQAIEYAKQNSANVKNAKIDLEIAKKKIWETTAIGLPQVNAKVSGSYMLTIPDKIKEFSGLSSLGAWMYGADQALLALTQNPGFGNIPEPTPTEPVSDADLKWGLTADLTVSQLIFSGAYLVGLQTSKTYKELSEVAITKSENDIVEGVTNAYYLVLILDENKTILESSLKNLDDLLNQFVQMNKQGFIDETDVDQFRLNISNITNGLETIKRQKEVAKYLLKLQMGYVMDNNIELTDNLEALTVASDIISLISSDFNVENVIDYKMLNVSEKMAKLNLKYQKSTFLPDVAAFYQHEENFNKNSFSFTPPNIIGVGMNIPIFGSGMKIARVKQAQLNIDKITNTKTQISAGLQTVYNDAKSGLQTAYAQYLSNKDNMKLAEKIYNKTLIKYKEGVSSSAELTQTQNQFLQAQSNYYTSILQLQNSKSKLEKLLTK